MRKKLLDINGLLLTLNVLFSEQKEVFASFVQKLLHLTRKYKFLLVNLCINDAESSHLELKTSNLIILVCQSQGRGSKSQTLSSYYKCMLCYVCYVNNS